MHLSSHILVPLDVDPRFGREQRGEIQRWLTALPEAAGRQYGQAVTATFLDGPVLVGSVADKVIRGASAPVQHSGCSRLPTSSASRDAGAVTAYIGYSYRLAGQKIER